LPTAEKTLLAFGIQLVALVAAGWVVGTLILVGAFAAIRFGAGVGFAEIWSALRLPLLFIAAGTSAQIVSVGWSEVGPTLGLVDADGLAHAGFVALRSLACVAALLLLALTTPLTSLLSLMRRCGLAADIADITLMMFRIIWLVFDCLETGRRSQAARLGHSTWTRTMRSNGLLLTALLPRVLARANRMNDGLAARGYNGTLRLLTCEPPTSRGRLAGVGAAVASLAALAWVLP
jgi:cobalt/nickel transport system permease protein